MTCMRYINNYYNRQPFVKRPWHTNVPNVGNKYDEPKRFRMFERWYKRPNKAHRLYRRLHGEKC